MNSTFSHQVVLVAILAFIFSTVHAQVAPPQMRSVNYLAPEAAAASWITDDKVQPSRYRVQIKSDISPTPVEWPCQVVKVSYDSEDAPYKQMNTKSNYECFNHCIQDPECNFVVRSSNPTGNNCFLKKNNTGSAPVDPDNEYAFINPYSNTTTINYISPNVNYQVKVAVYDTVLQAWSNFSDIGYFAFPRNMAIEFVRSGITSGSLQLQNGRSFAYRGFGVLTSTNQSSSTEILNMNTSSLITYRHPSGYFYIEDYSKFIVAQTEQECVDACFNNFECVQLVYFSEDFDSSDGTKIASKNSCYLNKKMDVYNGIYRTTNITVLTVEDRSKSIDLNNTEFGSWKFTLETLTIYGAKSNNSAITTYNITDASPILESMFILSSFRLTWKMPEPLAVKRSALYYTVNDSSTITYAFTASTDFVDPNQKIIIGSSFNYCFETCYKSQECLAYTYARSGECFLKTTTADPAPCANTSICGIFPETVTFNLTLNAFVNSLYCFYAYATTSFDYTTPVGRLICSTMPGQVTIEKIDEEFYPTYPGRIRCLPRDNNGKINWYKDFEAFDPKKLNGVLTNDNTGLTFYNVTATTHNGVYSCENILDNAQVLSSSNYVTVQVRDTVPEGIQNPIATLVSSKENRGILIQWEIRTYATPAEYVNLFFSNDSINYKNKTYYSPTLSAGSLLIWESFDCSVTFEIEPFNKRGSGGRSNKFKIPEEQCKENPPTKPQKSYFGAFIASIVAAGVLFIVSVVTIIMRCKSDRSSRNKRSEAFQL